MASGQPAAGARRISPQIPMSLRLANVHENVRSTLECGGSTPPWNSAEDKDKGGVEPPHSKVPLARPFS